MKKHISIHKFIPILFLLIFSLTGCKDSSPISKSATFFDTYITITVYDSHDTSLLDECISICEKYETLFSPSIENSDISRINYSNGEITAVSRETINLIKDSFIYSKATNGKYDISIYPVSKLWDFHNPDNKIPTAENINDAVKHVGYKNIIINDNNSTIQLKDTSCQIDLGSIAKGYIADKICDFLIENNVKSAIINLGGDIRILGKKPDNNNYIIGVQDPNNQKNIILSLSISDKSVTTSGTYERFIEYEGIKYHHILDPANGYPVDTDINSVTVISDSAETADALCTSIILLGSKDALPFIESFNNVEAIIVTNTNEIITTTGADKYIIN